jgi:aconitate hydratase
VPANLELIKSGVQAELLVAAGAVFKPCFCGPCFGAGDVPRQRRVLSIRHTTRNFPNREGSKPGDGQLSGGGPDGRPLHRRHRRQRRRITAATDLDVNYTDPAYRFDEGVYEKRVYNGWGRPQPETELKFGPNIKDWPHMPALSEDLLVKVCSYITDPVTTTDELIPSGETSSYRSNPRAL